ncbi:MAG: lamin tail domain-containing protein [Prolixibacteraceae bacterium]|nr:lamin tail domain-containing protein [Prolixibacteraceae bacterium]
MKKITLLIASLFVTLLSFSQLVITGVFDGPLSGGTPKAIEIYVSENIADLSIYGIGSANNGGGSDGEEFTFPAVAATLGDFIYLASESSGFNSFFGFAPNYTNSAAGINGDDAIELFKNGAIIDVFGDINTDGSGQAWEYQDGWAYRNNTTGPDGNSFVLANWSFSGPNALDGESSNATSATPFPIGSFTGIGAPSPTITVSLSSLTNMGYLVTTGPGSSKFFMVSGSILSNDIIITPSSQFEISIDDATWRTTPITLNQVGGNVVNKTIYVRMISGLNLGTYSNNIIITTTGGSTKTVSCSGNVIPDLPNLVINEIHADPDATNGDANNDGTADSRDDEFIEIVNNDSFIVILSGYTLSDGVSTRHTFGSNIMLQPGEAIVVFGGGTPTGFTMRTYTASAGLLGLNNSGDQITLRDPSGNVIDSYSYGSEAGNNQSLTRDPDITGSFVQHSTATGSAGALFSPATYINGAAFTLPLPPVPIDWRYFLFMFFALAGTLVYRKLN